MNFMFSGADPTFRNEVLSEMEVRPPKHFPKKTQLQAWADDFGACSVAAAGLALVLGIASADTGLRLDADARLWHDSSPGTSVAPPRYYEDHASSASESGRDEAWPPPSEQAFAELGASDPDRLAAWLTSGHLSDAHLSFAAEALGEWGRESHVPKLLQLLEHPSPIVREGAIYGLSHHLSEEIAARLRAITKSDPSPGVRSAVADVLTA